ncbi:SGNH/GDSL hydrolase family protein [Niabella drilacis]|uniref:Lysophospholipase L1 n=1 Tax=Niabella drilacis (strain DSM 25811 / CCM 8410 / CCUG 62505 / LMG 26954 / E90) TaxID=1285928 RepID=A0A1G6YE12_NIADE|nr:SGNH/GDSL hydrolase family protein [Niabella drilacis]SDD88243.1 Lysophospholipase L1 [Niabella drilacis]
MKRIIFLSIVLLAVYGFGKKEVKWVAIGDSITYLNDHLDETGNRVTKGYMTRVTEQLPFVRYINKGYNGWTAGGIAERFDSLYIPEANVYTIFLGTNDWWQGRPIGTLKDYETNAGNHTVYGSFRIIIDQLKKINSRARIILITPMKRTDFVYLFNQKNNAWGSYREKNGQTLAGVATAVADIGRAAHITVIDLYNDKRLGEKELVHFKRLKNPQTGTYQNYSYPAFQKIPFNPETDEYPYPAAAVDLTYDGLHPSDKGNRVIADRIVAVLKK